MSWNPDFKYWFVLIYILIEVINDIDLIGCDAMLLWFYLFSYLITVAGRTHCIIWKSLLICKAFSWRFIVTNMTIMYDWHCSIFQLILDWQITALVKSFFICKCPNPTIWYHNKRIGNRYAVWIFQHISKIIPWYNIPNLTHIYSWFKQVDECLWP